MKKLLIILFFIPLFGISQEKYKFKLKEHVVPVSLFFLSGVADGVADGLQFHYDKPDQFWNPDISWTNKYKNHDPSQGPKFFGSTDFLVWTTDGWHLMKFSRDLFTTGAITFKITQQKKKWWVYIVEGAGYWIVNRAGFALSYNLF